MDGHAYTDLTGVAAVALIALMCGIALERLRQPAFVGYIFAGLLLGPTALGFVSNRDQIDAIADLGVLMLLFIIGLELPLRLFVRLSRLSLAATGLQVAAATAVALLVSALLGWSIGMAMLLGFVVALSSTAVALKLMENAGETRTRPGRIALGVLIAQDLAFVPMILVLGMFSVGRAKYESVISIVGAVMVMSWLIWHLSRGGRIPIPFRRAAANNVDLTPLSGLAMCFGAAAVSGFLGLTPAYGAFLGGLVLGNAGTPAEREALVRDTRPIQSILMMAFFLSIGLLIDLRFIWDNLGVVLLLLFVVTIFKTAMNTAIFRLLGQSWPQAFLLAVMLAQIGEFSFLLARNGLDLALIGQYEMRLVVAVTVLSLAVSPVWVVTARRLHETTTNGISSLGELLNSVYAREAAFLYKLGGRGRRAAAWLRLRMRTRPRPSNENVAPAAPGPTVEILPPEPKRDAS